MASPRHVATPAAGVAAGSSGTTAVVASAARHDGSGGVHIQLGPPPPRHASTAPARVPHIVQQRPQHQLQPNNTAGAGAGAATTTTQRDSTLCSVAKVPVQFHWSLFLSIPFWLSMFMQGWFVSLSDYAWSLSLVAVLIASLLLHEFGHLAAMRFYRMPVSCVVLHALGGATVPTNQYRAEEYFSEHHWVAIANFAAGPAVNFALFGIMFGVRAALAAAGFQEGVVIDFWQGDDISMWLMYAGFINLTLGVYNLLPIFPLDGGHIFFHLFCMCLPKRWARYATSCITTLVALGVVGVEAFAMSIGDSNIVSLCLVALICVAAILLSCASSYDSYKEHQAAAAGSSRVPVAADGSVPHMRLYDEADVTAVEVVLQGAEAV